MRLPSLILLAAIAAPLDVSAGEAEVAAGQTSIERQFTAFRNGDTAGAYALAAPNIKRLFPTVEGFMGMVTGAYRPVHRPRNYAFGKVEEPSPTTMIQQVLIQGQDGKDYEAVYTLERQANGDYLITGVSLREAKTIGA